MDDDDYFDDDNNNTNNYTHVFIVVHLMVRSTWLSARAQIIFCRRIRECSRSRRRRKRPSTF